MRFIESHEGFKERLQALKGLASIDQHPSRDSVADFLAFIRILSFSSIFNRSFFRSIQSFCRRTGDEEFFLLVTDPDPFGYAREFGRYNAICCSSDDGPESYMEALNDGPLGSSPDSLVDSSNRLFFYSEGRKWLLISDRDTNLTYCFFADRSVMADFELSYEGDFFPDIASAEVFSRETASVAASLSSFEA